MRATAILLIAAAGCGGDTKGQGPEPAISETKLGTGTGNLVLRLLDQGSEPRRTLRYDLKDWKGGRAVLEMEISVAMQTKEGEAPRSMDVPPMRAAIDYAPVVVTPDGDLRAEFAMRMPQDSGQEGADVKGWTLMTPSGHVKDVGLEMAADAPPVVQQAMDGLRRTLRQMASPFPKEPVGKGARWELLAPIDMMGLRFDARALYRLDEPTEHGGKATLTMTIECSGDFAIPGNPMMKAKVESMRAEGSGTFAFDLRSLIPETEMETRMSMKLSLGRGDPVEQNMTMTMKFAPGE